MAADRANYFSAGTNLIEHAITISQLMEFDFFCGKYYQINK